MTIDSTENKNFIIDNQNKLIEFLYKQEETYINQLNEAREDKEAIYRTACDLVSYLEDTEKELRDKEEIDNFIAVIQNYSK